MIFNNKIHLVLFVFLLFTSCEHKEKKELRDSIQIIPQPKSIHIDSGAFTIDKQTVIYTNERNSFAADLLKSLIEEKSTFKCKIKIKEDFSPVEKGNIWLFNEGKDEQDESYELLIKESSLLLYANSNKGIMHGIQTLRQLFVDAFYSDVERQSWYLPCLQIIDEPRFKHRGMLLDCCRHFFDKEVVKKYIDLLAFYKMNVLHWHLTEDQGWRIEIDKYPKLTEVAAWRTEKNGERYGGFYTKKEIKEIVEYARQRNITIIPEIELPGHSQAAIAAYPHLSCTGKQVEVANDWGVFKEIYCAGNDSVFTFLEDILTEVMELFPSEYIHIGGDEAPKYRWENCDKCQERIRKEGLKDTHELQSYFIERIEKFLNKNGRKLIGWDEILEGGLTQNATVQSWRGMQGGIDAANAGHDAIMSPTSHCYFDYDLKSTDLEEVYGFDPIPGGLSQEKKHHIIGGECNMWTEHVPTEGRLDTMVFPRLLAMSEVLWSYPEERNFDSFYHRVQAHYPILDQMNVKYGLELMPAVIEVEIRDEQAWIIPKTGHSSIYLRFKWENYPAFKPFDANLKLVRSGAFFVQAYKDAKPYGNPIRQIFEYHKAIGKKVNYASAFSDYYKAGGDFALVDGKTASTDFRDGNWQGFSGSDLACIIDLGELTKISSINANFYQYSNAWIFLPKQVTYEYSLDGKNYFVLGRIASDIKPEDRGKIIENYTLDFDSKEAKYVRVTAENIKRVPDWHEAAGSEAWLFVDEIVVE
jgi:hexosaminidase